MCMYVYVRIRVNITHNFFNPYFAFRRLNMFLSNKPQKINSPFALVSGTNNTNKSKKLKPIIQSRQPEKKRYKNITVLVV